MDWFNELDIWMKVFWSCAMVGSVFFILQTALTLFGFDGDIEVDTDFDADVDGAGHSTFSSDLADMFTIRNFVNFFLGFGWTGVCLADAISNRVLLTIVAVVVGLAFVLLFVFVYKKLLGLEHNGAIDTEKDVVGKKASVYLRIPAGGEGKIQLSIKGAVFEFNAVAEDTETEIPTGANVEIVSKKADGLYVVK
ncbi:MAG: serine protease [Bacteroidaceae bacterium]|nr:serine protease [Bacteroidaceae bacterium]